MLAMHMFFMTPQRLAGTQQFNLYALPTTVTTNPGTGDRVIRGGDMSLYDVVTGLPVLVEQTTIGVNQ